MGLKEIKSKRKKPDEQFLYEGRVLNFNLADFWAWNQSDLIENRNRGILAEYIVKQALQIRSLTRLEWDSFDLETNKGIKVEIKSGAYIQAWEQKKFSPISFDIKPTRSLQENNNYSSELIRQADVYIFCLLHHKDQTTINPLNLTQWTFYVVTTSSLNFLLQNQKTVRISTIETIPHKKCTYGELKSAFNTICNDIVQ